MGICWMQSGTRAWCGDCCDLACCQTKPWGQQKVVIESTCVALTALSSCVNTGYKNWLCLQFSLIHYSALDIQGVNEKLSSGFAFGDPGCYTGLGGFSKDWFVEMLSLWVPFSFAATSPSKLFSVFLEYHQPLAYRTQLAGPGDRASLCAREVTQITPVIQQKMLQQGNEEIYPGPLKGISGKGEIEKSTRRRDRITPTRNSDFQGLWWTEQQEDAVCGITHDTRVRPPGASRSCFYFV